METRLHQELGFTCDRHAFILTLLHSCSSTSEPGESPYITSAGFQFLLLDTASQLWYFILQYLKTAQVHVDKAFSSPT